MVGMAYAAVPLYAMFCQLTGYGGTTQRVEQYSDRVLDRTHHRALRRQRLGRPALAVRAGGTRPDDADRRDRARPVTWRPTSSTGPPRDAPPST